MTFLADALEAMERVQDSDALQYGRKGMKWGQNIFTSGSGGSGGSKSEVAVKATPGRKVKTAGGKGRTASDDAVKAAVSKRVAKSSTTDALTNDELKALVNRMQLESSYRRLSAEDQSAGQKFMKRFFGNKDLREKDLKNVESLYGTAATVVTAAQVGNDIKKMKL